VTTFVPSVFSITKLAFRAFGLKIFVLVVFSLVSFIIIAFGFTRNILIMCVKTTFV
jgi:hypothetical protein